MTIIDTSLLDRTSIISRVLFVFRDKALGQVQSPSSSSLHYTNNKLLSQLIHNVCVSRKCVNMPALRLSGTSTT